MEGWTDGWVDGRMGGAVSVGGGGRWREEERRGWLRDRSCDITLALL